MRASERWREVLARESRSVARLPLARLANVDARHSRVSFPPHPSPRVARSFFFFKHAFRQKGSHARRGRQLRKVLLMPRPHQGGLSKHTTHARFCARVNCNLPIVIGRWTSDQLCGTFLRGRSVHTYGAALPLTGVPVILLSLSPFLYHRRPS